MIKVKNTSSRKNCLGSCIVPILGVICILVGFFAFSQLSSESYQENHGGWQDKIALIIFATLFSIVGIVMTFAGLFVSILPADKKERKSSSGCLSTFFWFVMVVVLLQYIDNWSWKRLEDYADNVIYAEFPKRFIYDKPGIYDFPLSFYQYRPSMAGNHKKTYLDLKPNQYQLSVVVKDSLGEQAVSVTGQKLHIKNVGDYVLSVDIKEETDSAYQIKREFLFHDLLVQDSNNVNTWVVASLETISKLLQQKAKIQVDSFGYRKAVSIAQLKDGFYLKDSLDFIKIPFAESEKTQLKTRPQGSRNSFFQGHKGSIYSFGGTLFESKKRPDNWLYKPEKNEWRVLPAIPISDDTKQDIKVIAVYSVAEKLFVMVRAKNHLLYQFDLAAEQPWKLVKQFSIAGDQTYWQFLNDKTLVAYNQRQQFSGNYSNQFVEGHLKFLDLESYQVRKLSATSNIISYFSDYYNFHAYENELYLYSSGRFYFLKEIKPIVKIND